MTAPLVFPVGHYVGAHYPGVDAPLEYHKVRVGAEVMRLPTEDQLRIWALCHGLPELVGQTRWTRDTILQYADHVAAPERTLDSVIAAGMAVEITPGTPQATEFARTHVMRPLLTGLGNSTDDPLHFAIGMIGTPVVKVDSFVYEMWQWCRLGTSLWDTAEMFRTVAEMSRGGAGAAEDTTEAVLTTILERLHQLLGYNAAYLDFALKPPVIDIDDLP